MQHFSVKKHVAEYLNERLVPMHIIAVGWLFVALMLALGQRSLVAGLLTFLAWGPLPLALFMYLTRGRARRDSMHMRDDSVREQDAAEPGHDP